MNQPRQLALVLLLPIAALFSPQTAHGADPEEAIIKGASDFLLDRAYDNYLYVLQLKLTSNSFLKTYFPETLRTAQAGGDLRTLLTHKDLLRDAVEKDLNKVVADKLVKGKLGPVIHELCGIALEETKCDKLIGKKDSKEIDSGSLEKLIAEVCPIALKDECGEIFGEEHKADSLVVKLNAFTDKLQEKHSKDPLLREPPALLYLPELLTVFGVALVGKNPADRPQIAISVILDILKGLERIESACKKDQLHAGTYTKCVMEVADVLKTAASAEFVLFCRDTGFGHCFSERALKMPYEDDDVSRFFRYALFFAQMADADDPNTVKALLKSVAVPAVSFGMKREPFRTRYLITAYVGGGIASTRSTQKSQTEGSVIAPVGFEISQAFYSGNSLSLLLSPIDLGYPLRLKLADNTQTVKLSDIVVPGVYVFYGLRNYPLALGYGYTRGRDPDFPDKRQTRIGLFLAIDMPLFTLH